MSELERDVAHMIIDALELEDISADDIDPQAPLFGDGLGLDSIDALELGLALQKRYGIRLDSDAEENRDHFASLRKLSALVAERRTD
ncbi:phosphopantetheine-binding protein [Kushneria aurantia]|uniref:Phosphopantetheine-binding protein n=1 Tax=Kushneria aurantia TaxID=504092 RepID=A0ABV6G0Y3_9GAMM|nr:phosphopantetheine-binding protein [Kushneria aurantia]